MEFVEKDATQIYWERPVTTDHPISANRPDLIVIDGQSKQTLLIDISILVDWNAASKEMEKIKKYSKVRTEICCMWGTKVLIVPVVVVALRTVEKFLPSFIELIFN